MSRKVTNFNQAYSLRGNGKSIRLDKPVVMGILNNTPDSFYPGGRAGSAEELLEQAEKHIQDGASILDIGAVSTRPRSDAVSEEEELRRLVPALKLVRNTFPGVFLSIDTYRSNVALAAAEIGADMINDISGGTFDEQMFGVMAQIKLPFVIMHIQGRPETMQENPSYKNVVKEVGQFFKQQIRKAKKSGVKQIIVDPGFGFGKTVEHNYQLLAGLKEFQKLGHPVLTGLSRKSMINKVLGTKAAAALNGTSVLNTIALLNGANILRVHDVKEAMETIKLVTCYKSVC